MITVIERARPKFGKGQKVEFIGGLGTIVQCNSTSGNWSYLVEMEMGSEPEIGRIGYETTILLFETDIILPEDYSIGA
ncbi:MAG: hypothetical protein RMZ41_023505 [Nostoc sp. DedVER02]|uniref:hypothetical protein n=1 Tax=unclassified Nostoc TaxID=2593658 RepID=UPI002AD343BC|nr:MULTISPECIES: hypothetical protein [unclassified Nostoc]MDZ7984547.1 hypothetical protein [Nostoc sp. DedVER02]MDZ8114391.1 hypothetical protein [Nostoc sp. DedVER01b]